MCQSVGIHFSEDATSKADVCGSDALFLRKQQLTAATHCRKGSHLEALQNLRDGFVVNLAN